MLGFSQYIETRVATELLAGRSAGSGTCSGTGGRHRRVHRRADRIAAGGTALDPEVVTQSRRSGVPTPSPGSAPRGREVLALMAEGVPNGAIARRWSSPTGVEKHVANIFIKLDLPPARATTRVLAVCLPGDLGDHPQRSGQTDARAGDRGLAVGRLILVDDTAAGRLVQLPVGRAQGGRGGLGVTVSAASWKRRTAVSTGAHRLVGSRASRWSCCA